MARNFVTIVGRIRGIFSEAVPMGRPIGVKIPAEHEPKKVNKVPVGFRATDTEVPSKTEKIWKEVDEAMDKCFKVLETITSKLVKFTSKLLLAAIIWIVLGHFVPEIRETLPAFYELVDGILWCFNGVLEWSLNGLKDLFGIG